MTSLPSSPRTSVLAPKGLNLTTGTAEIFRLPEVQDAIVGDFVILPCDLICEVSGRALWETWTTLQPPLCNVDDISQKQHLAQNGGFGVFYETKDATENGVGNKKEETDFLATTQPYKDANPLTSAPKGSLGAQVRNIVLSMPKDTLDDTLDEKKHLRMRTQLLRKYGRVKIQLRARDAHLYFLPYWTKAFLRRSTTFESFSEDVVGWWAKSTWQTGLAKKLGIEEALRPSKRRKSSTNVSIPTLDDDLDLTSLSSTAFTDLTIHNDPVAAQSLEFASRVPQTNTSPTSPVPPTEPTPTQVPPFLAYIHPPLSVPADTPSTTPKQASKPPSTVPASTEPSPLIRRIDTTKLLLSSSLYLARLPSILANLRTPPPAAAHSYVHAHQIHPTTQLPGQATIPTTTVLIDANVTLAPKITIRDSVVGANCAIASGARVLGCVLMEGVVVDERAQLSGCVLGRRCKIEAGAALRDCNVQDGYVVSAGFEAKGEVLAGFDEGDTEEEDEEEEGGLTMGD